MTATLLRTAAELHARARTGRRAVVMTMGALHEGHATLIRAARKIAGPDGEVVVTVFVNPPVRRRRGPGPLPAHPGRRRRAGRAVRRRRRVRPVRRRGLPGRRTAGPDQRRTHGRTPGGRRPPRPLRRHAHRRGQAAAPHPPRRRAVRAEGRPAARPDPAHGAGPELRHRDRRRAHRPRGGRARPVQPQPLPLARRAAHRARPVAGPVRGPRPARRAGGAARPGPRGAGHPRACRGAQRDRGVPRRAADAHAVATTAGGPPRSAPPPAWCWTRPPAWIRR